MKDNNYEEIIGRLQQVTPTPNSANKLTDSIINGIEMLPVNKKHYITINVSNKQWSVINGLRILLASAAIYLLGYFIFQQWEIKTKLDMMESNLTTTPYKSNLNIYEQMRDEKIQKAFNELQFTNAQLTEGKSQNEKLVIDRKSLNFLLQEIQKLQSENQSYRNKLLRNMQNSNEFK
jgi:hypothetical protein